MPNFKSSLFCQLSQNHDSLETVIPAKAGTIECAIQTEPQAPEKTTIYQRKGNLNLRPHKGNPTLTIEPLTYDTENHNGWVYILTNHPNGKLYIGVTSNLPKRIWEHQEGLYEGFTKQHGLKTLVWFQGFPRIEEAIHTEKIMKNWPRAWKIKRILCTNPTWQNLIETLI